MIKMIVTFVSLFLIFFFGIDIFRKLTKKEKWSVVKLASYSAGVSVLVIVLLILLVILF